MKFVKVRVDFAFNIVMKLPDDVPFEEIMREFPAASEEMARQYRSAIDSDPNLELIEMKLGTPELGEV